MHAFSTKFWVLQTNHCETVSCASTSAWHLWPPRCFFRRQESQKVTWCQDAIQINRWQSCCSNLDGSVMNIHHTVLLWQELTINFSVLWRSILVATDSKMLWKSKKLSFSGSITNLKILCCRLTFNNNTVINAYTFSLTTCKNRSLFFLKRNIIWNKKLSDKEIFTMHSYYPGAHGCTVGSGTMLQARRPQVRFLIVPLEFFIAIIIAATLWSWGWLSL